MTSLSKKLLGLLLFITSVSTCQAEVVLRDLKGQNMSMSSLKGKWVLINYWAGWCKTCIAEIPEFNHFYEKHKDNQVALFAINYDALPILEQQTLIKQLNINYPSLLRDPVQELSFGDISGVPVTFIFNPEGQLVKTLYGGQTAKRLEKAIAQTAG